MSEKKQKWFPLSNSFKFSVILSASVIILSALFYPFLPLTEYIPLPTLSEAQMQKVVIIDPGHGGVDSGAVSVTGREEKDLNLELAKKLGAFLEAGGARVIYTRTEDTLLFSDRGSTRKTKDLLGRVEIADQYPDALYISLHMNTLLSEKYRGLQTFYSSRNSASQDLAQEIQSAVCTLLQPENNRKAKDAKGNIFILDRIEQPAVLIECGFLTNNEEARLLEDDLYQRKLAFGISRPILDFLTDSEEN